MVNEVDAQAMLPDPRDDVLTGLTAISNFIGETKRRTQYLLDTDQIPGGRLGRRR